MRDIDDAGQTMRDRRNNPHLRRSFGSLGVVSSVPHLRGDAPSHVAQILISLTVIFSIENPMTIKETA
jgi:hypothetical protein